MKTNLTFRNLFALLFLITTLTSIAKAQTVSSLNDLAANTKGVYCPTDAVKLSANSTGTTFTWKRYQGTTVSGTPTTLTQNTADIVDNPTAPGYYTYVSIGLNAQSCESEASDPTIVYVLPAITASITSNMPTSSYCNTQVPTTLTLTATAGEATTVPETFAYTYQWYKSGNPITGATSATYTLNNTNDAAVGTNAYTVKINYQIKACTETESNSVNLTVTAAPTKPVVTITP